MDALATIHQSLIGQDFQGATPLVAERLSKGISLYQGCTNCGRFMLPSNGWYRILGIMGTFDGAAHLAAGSVGTITLTMNGLDVVLEPALSNENDWIWKGGSLLLPPRSVISVSFAPVGVTTVVQQFTVIHEKVRNIDPDGKIW